MSRKTLRALITLFIQLEQAQKAGVPLLSALASAQHDTPEPQLKRELETVYDYIDARGATLSEGLALFPRTFDETLVSLIRIGEKTGRMPLVLGRCLDYLRRLDDHALKMKRATRSAKISGVIILILAAFRGQTDLPWLVLYAAGFIGLFIVARRHVGFFRYMTDAAALYVPRLGRLMQQHSYARFAEGLALLYQSGIDLRAALETAALSIPNRKLRQGVEDALPRVCGGASLYEAFAEIPGIDRMTLAMIKAGERSGNIDRTLRELAEYFDKQTEDAVTAFQQFAEPLATLIVGALLFGSL